MIQFIEGEFYTGQIEFSNNGNASININDKEIFIHRKNTSTSLHLDTVRIQLFKGERKIEGQVVEVLTRFKKEYVGRVQKGKKSTFVVPDSIKIPVDFYIKGANIYVVQDWCNKNWRYSLGYGALKGFVHIGIREGRQRIRWDY